MMMWCIGCAPKNLPGFESPLQKEQQRSLSLLPFPWQPVPTALLQRAFSSLEPHDDSDLRPTRAREDAPLHRQHRRLYLYLPSCRSLLEIINDKIASLQSIFLLESVCNEGRKSNPTISDAIQTIVQMPLSACPRDERDRLPSPRFDWMPCWRHKREWDPKLCVAIFFDQSFRFWKM